MWLTSSENLLRILAVGSLSYVGLIIILKISGKRTLSQMNSFDFIITIAMGSTFSSGLLQKSIPLSETMAALSFLVLSQFIITFISIRSETFKNLVTARPTLLFKDGTFSNEAMLKSRINKDEIWASIRQQGIDDIDKVQAIYLESNGSLSVITKVFLVTNQMK